MGQARSCKQLCHRSKRMFPRHTRPRTSLRWYISFAMNRTTSWTKITPRAKTTQLRKVKLETSNIFAILSVQTLDTPDVIVNSAAEKMVGRCFICKSDQESRNRTEAGEGTGPCESFDSDRKRGQAFSSSNRS